MITPIVNSHNGWDTLNEVWLGDTYPMHWYDHLNSEIRDTFYQITEITQKDLNKIQTFLESRGIRVRRPEYKDINDFIFYTANGPTLKRPQICPRDYFVVVGNKLIGRSGDFVPWQQTIDQYKQNPDVEIIKMDDIGPAILFAENQFNMSGANIVRAGRDLFVDCGPCIPKDDHEDQQRRTYFDRVVKPMFPEYRCHYVNNGGHIDGCFCLLKPGYILATGHYNKYSETFPGWELINASLPEFINHKGDTYWWMDEIPFNNEFNQYLLTCAKNWVGNYHETVFEVNSLILDPENILMLGYNEKTFQRLNNIGFTVHSTTFDAKSFWDGGLHCLTLDINRNSQMVDYFS